MTNLRWIAATIAVVGVAAAAAAAAMDMPMGPADKAYMDSMKAMSKDMDAPMSGNPDKDFVTMMLPHHQGAVAMAKIELQYGKDPLLRAMAKDIIASQDKEIATMKAWQGKHGR